MVGVYEKCHICETGGLWDNVLAKQEAAFKFQKRHMVNDKPKVEKESNLKRETLGNEMK